MNTIAKYAHLVKFSHTIFALPFALAAYAFALVSTSTPFNYLLLLKIIVCMITARNAAMGFNRWADRDVDALNPRTASREIPSGKVSAKAALWFVVVNCVLFVLTAAWINRMCLYLSPVALIILLGYSTTKRYTAWSHIVLGVAVAIAPAGAYMAVTGTLSMVALMMSAALMTWNAGFDILYAMQDREFDREHNLHSVPARFSPVAASAISIVLHLLTAYCVVIIKFLYPFSTLYTVGVALFVAIMVMQHILYRPSRTDLIGRSFALINGSASIIYAALFVADLILNK